MKWAIFNKHATVGVFLKCYNTLLSKTCPLQPLGPISQLSPSRMRQQIDEYLIISNTFKLNPIWPC